MDKKHKVSTTHSEAIDTRTDDQGNQNEAVNHTLLNSSNDCVFFFKPIEKLKNTILQSVERY